MDFLRAEPISFANVAGRGVGDGSDAISLADYINSQFDSGLNWETVDWMRSIWKGPVGRITDIHQNTGDHIWATPHGDAPDEEQDLIRNHPLLQGVEGVPINPGRRGHAAMVVTPTLLLASGQTSDGTPHLFAIDKRTGKRVGAIELPGSTRYGMSSWVHEGRQFVLIQLEEGLAAIAAPLTS